MSSFIVIIGIVEVDYKIGVLPTADFDGDQTSLIIRVRFLEVFLGLRNKGTYGFEIIFGVKNTVWDITNDSHSHRA